MQQTTEDDIFRAGEGPRELSFPFFVEVVQLQLTLIGRSLEINFLTERKSASFWYLQSSMFYVGCKMEMRNSQREEGQPREQTSGLFSMLLAVNPQELEVLSLKRF